MANIIYQNRAPNNRIEGLPYPNRFEYVRPVIFDSVPSVDDLKRILSDTTENSTLVAPWSLDVVKGFRDYVPTTFKMVTQGMDKSQFTELFGLPSEWIPEPERVLLQLQSEFDAKSATLDAAATHNRKDLDTIVNKAHLVNRLYLIGRIYNHVEEREYPMLFGDLTKEDTWNDVLLSMKETFIDYFLQVPLGKRKYDVRIRTAEQEVTPEELQERYVYIDWLKQKLGDDLLGVLLYGSAARATDPSQYSDFDNWVRVKDLTKAHKILRGTCPAVLNGKVVELSNGEHPEGAKHLGIHLFPENQEYLLRFVRFLHDSREFLEHTKVVYGEFPFIKVKQDEIIERGISHAYIKLKTIAGALNWAYTFPEKMLGKPPLFEFIVKNVRFFHQHALNAVEGPNFRSKQVLNQRLAEKGLHIPDYIDVLNYIKESMLHAMYSVLTLQSDFLNTGRRPNLKFLNDDKKYDWGSPEIDEWQIMGDLS